MTPPRTDRRFHVSWQGLEPRLLRELEARADARLVPGIHILPIGEKGGLKVEVAKGTVVATRIHLGPPTQGAWTGGPVVRSLALEFDPPIVLPNVVQALIDLKDVCEDRILDTIREVRTNPLFRFLGKVANAAVDASGIPAFLGPVLHEFGISDWARDQYADLGSRLREGALEPGRVMLASARGRGHWNEDQHRWDLILSFSGHVELGDSIDRPFWDVVLPEAILPVVRADLAGLLGGSPLASARLRTSRIDMLASTRAILDIVQSVNAGGTLISDLPGVEVHARLADHTDLRFETLLPETLHVEWEAGARIKDLRIRGSVNHFRARIGDGSQNLAGSADFQARIVLDPEPRTWHDRVNGRVRLVLDSGSILPRINGSIRTSHPLAGEVRQGQWSLLDTEMAGDLTISRNAKSGGRFRLDPGSVEFSTRVEVDDQVVISRKNLEVRARVPGAVISGRWIPVDEDVWDLDLKGDFPLELLFSGDVPPLPELCLSDSRLAASIEAGMDIGLGARVDRRREGPGDWRIDPRGVARIVTRKVGAELDGRRLEFPKGAEISAVWREGALIGGQAPEMAFDLAWTLHGQRCLLFGPDRCVSVLTRALREGELTVLLSPGGRVSFSGKRDGLYGVGFFNALLNPASRPHEVLDLLGSEDVLAHVVAVLQVFNPELGDHLARARGWLLGLRGHFEAEEINRPGDAIPRVRLTRIASRILSGEPRFAGDLEVLIRDVTEGRGLDLRAAKAVVRDALPDLDADFEVDRILRLVDTVTRPGEPVPLPEMLDAPPIDEDPEFDDPAHHDFTARELYEIAARGRPTPGEQVRIADMAPALTLAQLDFLLAGSVHWRADFRERLEHVRRMKRSVARLDEDVGLLALAGRASRIAAFLGDALGPLPGIDRPGDVVAPCALGPRDIAILLRSGLAEVHPGLQSQINTRLVLECIRNRPGDFLRAVLVEMSDQVPRVLAGVLLALLNTEQNRMREPLDLPGLVAGKIGLSVPRIGDFMAGGRRVRDSYFEEMNRLAEAIYEQARPYLARRARLREVCHDVPPVPRQRGASAALERDALAAIEEADRVAGLCRFDGRSSRDRVGARAAYRRAFESCAAFLERVPMGFQLPWMKAFWRRNEEALKVLSVVRNYQDDVDQVRMWLEVTSGRDGIRAEQDLLETVVHSLFALPEDRQTLLGDPLVRLLVDPDPGRYDFTIVSAMGVITDGAEGRELEDTYTRIGQQRGIRVARAHTGLFRSLEFNASAIIKAAESTETPWGWIGYSQGCANALMAESFLRGGTPLQQGLLDRLVCRNLLYSAANGSAHGTSGTAKYVRAMVEGERFLKHYQVRFSREAIDLFLRALRTVLDSREFVSYLGGAYSLTLERALALHRDGQFAPWAPTSTTRGIVPPDRLPEALEYLYHVHCRLIGNTRSDTQVRVEQAVGHSTLVSNRRTKVLERCDMGSFIQNAHHWSPLSAEVEQVMTERDRALAIYDGPKDRHVFPWVEVNARFGRIRRVTSSG
jgi:hypothetical protein